MSSESSEIPSIKAKIHLFIRFPLFNIVVVAEKVNLPKDVSKSTVDLNDSNSSDIPSAEKFGDFDGKVNPHSDVLKSKCHSDSDSVEIINFSVHFSPYKSQLERVISEEVSLIAKEEEKLSKKEKRKLALLCWKWEEVVDLYEDEELGVDLPFIPVKKKVKVSIQSRNRVMKLYDESDVDE
ncbi:unnamed protein product [Lactuca virosa]|uniref:Uncharacterized protein n=1 Tax=Lactuca virosa TaxID=75947 RepID=A0AAU9N1D6_9ASTR|nr:unnamed protein product [Lactuca virosa]